MSDKVLGVLEFIYEHYNNFFNQ